MSKASDAGKAFLAGVLAKLPQEQRAQAEAIFTAAGTEAALEVIGTGTLGQSEINRQFDELKTQRESLTAKTSELTDWYEQNKSALEEYLVIKPEYEKVKGNNPDPLKPAANTGLTKEEIAQDLERRDRAFAGALALATDLSSKHFAMFTEPLSTSELLADPKLGRPVEGDPNRVYGLQDAYNTKHGARVTEKQTAAEAARIQKLVDDGVAAKLKAMPQHQPFPLRDASPSPLDALTNPERKTTDYSVDTAVAEYERLSSTRTA